MIVKIAADLVEQNQKENKKDVYRRKGNKNEPRKRILLKK